MVHHRHQVRKIGRTPTVAIGALVFLFLVYGMNAVCRQLFYYVLPSMVVEFKPHPEEAGVISAVVTMLVATVAIPAGKWFDRGGHGWARKYRNGIVAARILSLLRPDRARLSHDDRSGMS